MSCNFPEGLGAGLTFDALLTLTAYQAPDWVVTVLLRGPSVMDLLAIAEGSQHRIHADAATTANWAPGIYWFSVRAARGAEVVEVDSGQITIRPDLSSAAANFDGRTKNQIALDAIEAVIAQRATLDQERYRINNRELYRTAIPDLLKLRDHYLQLVKREQAAASGKNLFGTTVRVRLR